MRPLLAAVLFLGGLVALVGAVEYWGEVEPDTAPPRQMLTIGDWDTSTLFNVEYDFDIGISPTPLMRVSEDQFRQLMSDILFEKPMPEYIRSVTFCDVETGEHFRPSGKWCWSERSGYSDRGWGEERIIEILRE